MLGAGRFESIGIPWPEVLGPFVGVVETVCDALIILGFLTRLAVIPLIIVVIDGSLVPAFATVRPADPCCA